MGGLPQPEVGRIVHYINDADEHQAAIITDYQGAGVINAHTWSRDGQGQAVTGVHYSSVPRRLTWHWPESA